MLNIPDNYRVELTEMVCRECANEFYTSSFGFSMLLCPYCGKEAWANGEFTAYIRHNIKTPE